MDDNKDVHIDYQSIARQIVDNVIRDFILAIVPDDKNRKFMLGLLNIHRKYGIDAVTSIKILQDMVILNEEMNE